MRQLEYVTDYFCNEHHGKVGAILEPCEPSARVARESKMVCGQCGGKPRAFQQSKHPR